MVTLNFGKSIFVERNGASVSERENEPEMIINIQSEGPLTVTDEGKNIKSTSDTPRLFHLTPQKTERSFIALEIPINVKDPRFGETTDLIILWVVERHEWVVIEHNKWVESGYSDDETYYGPRQLDENCEKKLLEAYEIDWLPLRLGVVRQTSPEEFISEIIANAAIKKLEELNLADKAITALPPEIGQLTHLKTLNLSNNQLASLPSQIGYLKNLQVLHIRNNPLDSLPLEIRQLKKLAVMDLRETNIPIPLELKDRLANPEEKFEFYFSLVPRSLALNESKLIVVGQPEVGKTSLINRILRSAFDQNQNKTQGISITQWQVTAWQEREIKDQSEFIKLNTWDFGGQEIMHATHQFFLTKRSLYLLVLDSRLTQEENRVEYWLKIIQSFGGESPVLIVGNKIDQHPLDIDRTGLQKKYSNIVGILETSAATGTGIEELKATITERVNNLPHVRDLLPETWFTVKTKLEELGRQSNFITHDKYLDLCTENEISDEISQRTLIGFLHDLGVVLHFQDDPRLEALGILNPQWVTNGVYKILNSHTLFQNKGVLTVSMLDEILNLPEYPRGKRLFIVDMMKKFELCYDLELDKTFLVPDLLPKDQPDLQFNGIPAFEYAYPVLPSSVITRFIVRMNQKIEDGLVWRTGVLLKIGENTALVKADIEDRKITIAIDGLEHTRRDALSAIRYQLDEIHGSIKGLSPEKFVPIPGAESQRYEFLLQLEHDGVKVLPVPGKGGGKPIMVDVSQLLSGVESESQRKDIANRVTNIYIQGDVKDSNILAGDGNTAENQ